MCDENSSAISSVDISQCSSAEVNAATLNYTNRKILGHIFNLKADFPGNKAFLAFNTVFVVASSWTNYGYENSTNQSP